MRTLLGRSGFGLLVMLLMLVVPGCSADPETGPRSTSSSPPSIPTKPVVPAPPTVEMKAIKFADFDGLIKQHRGKVVLVDFWADFCIPCKIGFPHLVDMHKKYEKQGLVIVSVNINDPRKTAALTSALGFLKQQKATFTNLKVDSSESPAIWISRLGFLTIPHKHLYTRQGTRVTLSETLSEDDLEKEIKRLLEMDSGAGN